MTSLEKLEKLDPELLIHYRQTGESSALSPELKIFVDQLSAAFEIHSQLNSVTRAAKELMIRRPDIKTIHHAKRRIYEAIQFFHVDNNVSNDVWDDFYADYYDRLVLLCIADNRFEAAGRYIKEAHSLRTRKETRINPEDLQGPTLIVGYKIKAEDLGFVKTSLLDIATKAKNGKYIDMIDNLPISDKEKKQILHDADIEDAEIIEDNE
jgi:hypothetical protein